MPDSLAHSRRWVPCSVWSSPPSQKYYHWTFFLAQLPPSRSVPLLPEPKELSPPLVPPPPDSLNFFPQSFHHPLPAFGCRLLSGDLSHASSRTLPSRLRSLKKLFFRAQIPDRRACCSFSPLPSFSLHLVRCLAPFPRSLSIRRRSSSPPSLFSIPLLQAQ